MEKLVQPDKLRARIVTWAEEEIRLGHLTPKATAILEAVLYRSELPRGEVPTILGQSTRQTRRVVSALIESEALTSNSSRAPLRLNFPARLASRWMPGLFPDEP